MEHMGSLAWATKNGGRLTASERFRFTLSLVWAKLGLILKGSGVDAKRAARVDPGRLAIPRERLSREAEAYCREVSSETLYQHCMRAYCWGALLAQYDQEDLDVDQFFTAAMLHDLGLTETHHRHSQIGCFAVQGARAAEQFLTEAGAEPHWRDGVCEAISLHLNATVPINEHGPEAYYLNVGTLFDVIGGGRFSHVPKQAREQVLADHPRGPFKKEVCSMLQLQMKERPQSRIAQVGRLGLLKLIRKAPYES